MEVNRRLGFATICRSRAIPLLECVPNPGVVNFRLLIFTFLKGHKTSSEASCTQTVLTSAPDYLPKGAVR